MNNELKASQKWWKLKRCIVLDEDDGEGALEEPYKTTYDRLVTLEAKIELLNLFTKHYDDGERFLGFLEDHESELAELVKELKI